MCLLFPTVDGDTLLTEVATQDLFACYDNRHFWFRWNGNGNSKLEIGFGTIPGFNTFITYTELSRSILFIGFESQSDDTFTRFVIYHNTSEQHSLFLVNRLSVFLLLLLLFRVSVSQTLSDFFQLVLTAFKTGRCLVVSCLFPIMSAIILYIVTLRIFLFVTCVELPHCPGGYLSYCYPKFIDYCNYLDHFQRAKEQPSKTKEYQITG